METKTLNDDLDAIGATIGKTDGYRQKIPMTKGILCTIGETIAAVGRAAGRGDKALADRLAYLEQRIAALEENRLAYAGIHEDGKAYRAGEVVTRRGALWVAERDTHATPGTPESGWRLCVKAFAYDEKRR